MSELFFIDRAGVRKPYDIMKIPVIDSEPEINIIWKGFHFTLISEGVTDVKGTENRSGLFYKGTDEYREKVLEEKKM